MLATTGGTLYRLIQIKPEHLSNVCLQANSAKRLTIACKALVACVCQHVFKMNQR